MSKIKSRCALLLLILILFSTGCGKSPTVETPTPPSVCPDTVVEVSRMVFSDTPFQKNSPESTATVFQPTDQTVYSTFWLSAELCCTRVLLDCQYEGNTVFSWEERDGLSISQPQTVEITMPSGEFQPGDYTVIVYIDIREALRVHFTVV